MVRPRKEKPPVKGEEDESDDGVNVIKVGNKQLNVSLSLTGRGIILIYALAFALIVGTVGWVAYQLIVAWKMTPYAPAGFVGFLAWVTLAFTSAWLSR